MKESKFVKAKIAAGYVILIAACILSVGYVYREAVRLSAPDGSYALLRNKRSAVNQVLYHLYQAESYGQLMIAGYQSFEGRYRRELRTVRARIDSLRSIAGSGDSLQTMRLDSIVRLLADKERRTMSLRRSIRAGATSRRTSARSSKGRATASRAPTRFPSRPAAFFPRTRSPGPTRCAPCCPTPSRPYCRPLPTRCRRPASCVPTRWPCRAPNGGSSAGWPTCSARPGTTRTW